MKKHAFPLMVTLLVFILFGMIYQIMGNLKPKKISPTTPSSRESRTPPKLAPAGIPQEQYEFMNLVLMPSLDSARTTYPVLSIRKKIDAFMEKIEKGQVRLIVQTQPAGSAMAAANMEAKNPQVIRVFLPTMMLFFQQINADLASFTDDVVATFLHEAYHLEHHMVSPTTPHDPRRAESEAWAWTIREVYQPMIQAGRLQMVDNTVKDAIRTYAEVRGDTNAPRWKSFIEKVIAPNQLPPPK